jgi:hypothetical protein
MSESVLTVPTAFTDIAQLAEGLTGRVEQDKLMLYGPEPYDPGTVVQFVLTLYDGSAALEGIGRAIQSVDGGEERPDVARFDIILDSLEFTGTAQVVYDRILMVQQQSFDGPSTGEVYVDDVRAEANYAGDYGSDDYAAGEARPAYEAESGSDIHSASAPPVDFDGDGQTLIATEAYDLHVDATKERPSRTSPPPRPDWSESPHEAATAVGEQFDVAEESGAYFEHSVDTGDVDLSAVEAMQSEPPRAYARPAPPAAPSRAVDHAARPVAGRLLSRPSRHIPFVPDEASLEAARPETGYFHYAGGLPVPATPPRPDIDPTQRVSPAPRPETTETSHAAPPSKPRRDYAADFDDDLGGSHTRVDVDLPPGELED